MKVFHHLETIVHASPLGIACFDISTQMAVTAGLLITATRTGGSTKAVRAIPTRSGVYAFNNVPGLRSLEYFDSQSAVVSPPLSSPPAALEFAIQLEDLEKRFLPWGMVLSLPRRDLLTAFLFSAPSRATASGLGVIRGQLNDVTRTQPDGAMAPASHARVEAQYQVSGPPTVYVALTDARGQFAIFMPFPNPLLPPAGALVTSPNSPGRKILSELRWPVTLSFFYEPHRQRFVCTRPNGRIEIVQGQREGLTDGSAPPGWRCIPDLPSLLRDQTVAATIERPATSPAATSLEAEVEFGKETIVRGAEGDPDTSVWVRPAPPGSP